MNFRFPAALALVLLTLPLRAAGPSASAPVPGPEAAPWAERPVRVPPLFWYDPDAEGRRLLMVAMLYWDVREGAESQKLLLPVFYHWRAEDRSLLVSLPFVMAYSRPREKWMVAGLFYRSRDEKMTRTALFPFYWQQIRPEGGRVTSFPPFLFYDYRSRDRTKMDQASLVGWRRRRGDSAGGFLLNYAWSQSPESRFRTLFPVYWHARAPRISWTMLTPFYRKTEWDQNQPLTSTAAPAGVSQGLFPVVGWGRRADGASGYLFPFFYHDRSENGSTWLTIPAGRMRREDQVSGYLGLYFFSHDTDRRVDGLFPFWSRSRTADHFGRFDQWLNFYDRQENGERFQTLFPLYGYWRTPEGSQFLSWGIWRQTHRDPDVVPPREGSAGWAYLYLWKNVSDGDSTRIFFPLYWHYYRHPDWSVDEFFPFYTRYRDGATSVTVIPPMVWLTSPERNTFSFLFLYWKDQSKSVSSVTLFPLYHENDNARRRMYFTPLSWYRKSAASREGVVPLAYWYRSDEKSRTGVFPLFWNLRTPDTQLRVILPYYRVKKTDLLATGVFPLWGVQKTEKERGSYVMPLYWSSSDGKGNGLWIIPPMLGFVSQRDAGKPQWRRDVQYLLLGGYHRRGGNVEHGFYPLFEYIHEGDFVNFWAPRAIPLMAWERRKDLKKGYVFPCAWRRSPEADWNLFLPLWYGSNRYEVHGTSPAVRGERVAAAHVLFPLYWGGRSGDARWRYVVPLWAQYREGPLRVSVAPLWVSRDGTAGGKFRTFFPVYWRVLTDPQPDLPQKDISVYGLWYRLTSASPGRRSRTVGLAPFFSNTIVNREDRYFEILGGLFARDIQNNRRRFRWFYLFYTNPKPLNKPA